MRKIKEKINKIESIKQSYLDKAQKHLDILTKPLGSLGRLEELVKQIVGITENEAPIINKKVIFTLAADHGVTEEGVSAYPSEVTAQMVANFLNKGAAINVLADSCAAKVVVADLGVKAAIPGDTTQLVKNPVAKGTQNMTKGPAMTKDEAIQSIETGIALFEKANKHGLDLVGIGEMGIGNTTASSAITVVLTGANVDKVTGRGTGINDVTLKNKQATITKAIKVNNPKADDPMDVLAKVGGFEIGGMCGIILAAAAARVPVVIDGFISGASALLAYSLAPQVKDYIIASHCSVECGHRFILEHMALKPILDLNLCLGEGTGAALAMPIIESSLNILNNMATFESAGVSKEK